MYYGYHRTSTKEQHADRGIIGIQKFCDEKGFQLEKIYVDKVSGRTFERPRYTVMKEDILRNGDTLVVFELDRLGRNKAEILTELLFYKEKGVRVIFLDIPTTAMDMSGLADNFSSLLLDTVNNILIEIVSMSSEAEIERKRKRCDEGRAAMKARGEWGKYGRPRIVSKGEFAEHFKRVERKEIRSVALMKELGLKRDTYFRYVREYKAMYKT